MSGWLSARRASVETIVTDVFNPAALAQTLESLAGRYDGVAVVALDHQSVRAAIDDLVAGGACVVTLVSDVPGIAAPSLCRHRQRRRRTHGGHADRPARRRRDRARSASSPARSRCATTPSGFSVSTR